MPDLSQKPTDDTPVLDPSVDPSVALHIKTAETRLSRLVRKQFLYMTFAVIGSVILVVVTFYLISVFTRVPTNTALLAASTHARHHDYARIGIGTCPSRPSSKGD
jgi:hypothetical protein